MSWLTLLILVTGTWLLWAVGALVELKMAIRKGRLPAGSSVSLAPVIPLFPLFFFGIAIAINLFAPPWGTWIIGGLHALLFIIFSVVVVITACRGGRTGPAA